MLFRKKKTESEKNLELKMDKPIEYYIDMLSECGYFRIVFEILDHIFELDSFSYFQSIFSHSIFHPPISVF